MRIVAMIMIIFFGIGPLAAMPGVEENCDVFLVALAQSNAYVYPPRVGSIATRPGEGIIFNSGVFSDVTQTGGAWAAFAKVWHAATGRTALIVNAAVSGSALLAAADSGNGYWAPGGGLLAAAQSLWNGAMNAVPGICVPIVRGTITLQGERDAGAINDGTPGVTGAAYQAELPDVFANLRAIVKNQSMWIVRPGTMAGGSDVGFAAVRQAWESVTYPADPNAIIVHRGTVNFPAFGWMMPDGLHYNQDGYNDVGSGAATEILDVLHANGM